MNLTLKDASFMNRSFDIKSTFPSLERKGIVFISAERTLSLEMILFNSSSDTFISFAIPPKVLIENLLLANADIILLLIGFFLATTGVFLGLFITTTICSKIMHK